MPKRKIIVKFLTGLKFFSTFSRLATLAPSAGSSTTPAKVLASFVLLTARYNTLVLLIKAPLSCESCLSRSSNEK